MRRRQENIAALKAMAVLGIVMTLIPCACGAQATFNVKTYGAQGDDLTDDTRAVQAAINAARAAGGSLVYFPASSGCYIVSGLTFYSNVSYTGESQGVCIKSVRSSATLVATPSGSAFSNVTISNLTFNGNATSYTGYDCLELRGPTNVWIDHVTTTRCGEDGIYITGWGNGPNPAGQGNGLLITNVTSSYNGRNGLSIIAGLNITVRDSVFEEHHISAPFAGVDIEPNTAAQSVGNVTFERCTFLNNKYHGFNVWESHANRPNLNLRLVNSTFEGNGRDGAYIAGSGYVLGGIYVSGNMSGNQSQGGYRGGLDVWNATGVVATNLSVTGASQAVFLWGVNGAKVANASLSGSFLDLNTNSSTNVQVYTSTQLAHQTHSGRYSVSSGAAPRIMTESPWPATVNTSYSDTLAASGDPAIVWGPAAGTLPSGLALSSGGTIAGTPTSAGAFSVTVQAGNGVTYDEKTFTMTVAPGTPTPPPSPSPLMITTSSLAGGAVGSAYSATVSATGGTPPYAWSATGLPSGLSMNPSTGQISGTPTTAGLFAARVQVQDTTLTVASTTITMSVTAAPSPVAIPSSALPGATVGSVYSATVSATGGAPPYNWSATGLPTGLSMNSSMGQITGTPTTAGSFAARIQVQDTTFAVASATLSISVAPAPSPSPLAITTSSLTSGTVSSSYSATLSATGGTPPYAWSASGLPSGLSVNSSTGQITGTPTTAGSFNVSVQVRDATASLASAGLSLAVASAPPPPPPSQQTFNVQTYGARGDGSTNDTGAVQAAINAANAAGSGIVYFPASTGCYMVTSLTFYSNLSYTGQNESVCVKSIADTASIVQTPSGSAFSNSTISYLTFVGHGTLAGGYDCLELRGPTKVLIDHVTTTQCAEDGFYITGYGTNLATAGDGLLVTNSNASYNGRNGMSIITGKNIVVRNSVFEHSNTGAPYDGVDIEPNRPDQTVENITFEDSSFLNNGNSGSTASGHNGFNVWEAFGSLPNLNLRLIHCTFSGNVRDGLYAAASGYTLSGIYVIGGTMSNNQALNGYRGGVDIWNASNVVVSDLSVTSPNQAVFLYGVNGATVASSTLSGASLDLNTNNSTNVQVFTSTTLVHGTHSGSYATPSGSAPTITTTSLPAATNGTAYATTLGATGTPTINWITLLAMGDSLPPGMTLSSSGILSGTPTAPGTYTFTVEATNGVALDESTFTMTVN